MEVEKNDGMGGRMDGETDGWMERRMDGWYDKILRSQGLKYESGEATYSKTDRVKLNPVSPTFCAPPCMLLVVPQR